MTAKMFSLTSLAAASCIQLFGLDQIVRMGHLLQVLRQVVCQSSLSQRKNQGHKPEGRHQYDRNGNLDEQRVQMAYLIAGGRRVCIHHSDLSSATFKICHCFLIKLHIQ